MSQLEPVASASADLDTALREAVAPVLAQLEQLDAEVAAAEATLAALRDARKRAERVLAAVDPDAAAARRPAATASAERDGRVKGALAKKKADDARKRARLEEYVRAHPGEDFIAARLSEALTGVSPPKARDLLAELADAGVLRLQRVGVQGGGKVYRLVAP